MYATLDDKGYIKYTYNLEPAETSFFIENINDYQDERLYFCTVERRKDKYYAVLDKQAYQAHLDQVARQQEEAENIKTPQEEIEALKAENKELKEYVELISDSVVDLALRTLKEV